MKKIMLLLTCCLGVFIATSQKINHTAVPGQVKKVFMRIYPNTKTTWNKENGNYEANFSRGGKNMSTVINDNGNIIETEAQITLNQLPAKIKNYIISNYNNQKITEAAKITKVNGEINYAAEIKQGDLFFDSAGNFIRIDTKEKGKKEDKD